MVKLYKVVLKQFLFHLLNIFIAIFLIVPLWTLFNHSQIGYSILTALIYCITMYSIGWNCGNLDARKIPGYYPEPKFPLIAAGLGLIIPIILLIMKYAFPDIWHTNLPFMIGETEFLFSGNRVSGTTDFIFKLWYFPFEAFISGRGVAAAVAIMLVQPIMLIAGYFVGTTRFRMIEAALGKLVYEKRRQKNENKNGKPKHR